MTTIVMPHPDPDSGPHQLTVEVGVVAGRLGCIRLELVAGPSRPIGAVDIRQISIGGIVDQLAAQVHDVHSDVVTDDFTISTNRMRKPEAAVARSALVAKVYVQALLSGRKPTRAVQRTFSVSYSNATRMINLARERGMLTAAPARGQAGGHLTDAATDLLHGL